MKKWMIIVAGVIVLAGGGIAAYMMINGQKSSVGTDSSTNNSAKDGTATARFTDACAVVSKTDVDAAFGVTYKQPKKEADGIAPGGATTKSCKFDELTDESPTALMKATNFSIEVDTYTSTEAAKTTIESTRKADKLGNKIYFVRTDVAEVGDEAFFFQGQAPGVLKTEEYMYARKGNQIFHFVAVRINGIDHDKAKAAITTLAKKALN